MARRPAVPAAAAAAAAAPAASPLLTTLDSIMLGLEPRTPVLRMVFARELASGLERWSADHLRPIFNSRQQDQRRQVPLSLIFNLI